MTVQGTVQGTFHLFQISKIYRISHIILDIVVYKITQRIQEMMHIIVYQDYTDNTEYIVLQTIIANKVSINTEI